MAIRSEALDLAGSAAPDPGWLPVGKVRTVVVDNLPVMLEAISTVLQAQDRVEIVGGAHDGAEAVEAVAALRPHLVLMDVRMPRMDGLQAATLMARHFPATRIVLMSGEESPELREAARGCGADAFVFKVNLAGEFMALLDELFPEGDTACIV